MGEIEHYLQQALTQTYHRQKKRKLDNDINCAKQKELWGAEAESRTTDELIKRRKALQTRLEQRNKKYTPSDRKERYANITQAGEATYR